MNVVVLSSFPVTSIKQVSGEIFFVWIIQLSCVVNPQSLKSNTMIGTLCHV